MPSSGALNPAALLSAALNPEEDSERSGDPECTITKIGRYTVRERLGGGGFGEVYLASDDDLERLVAIKLIKKGGFGESNDALMAEGRTLAQLEHPGIVKIHHSGIHEGRIYFVSPFVEGDMLRQFVIKHRPNFDETAELVAQIAEALDYAHRQMVIHRDIKPTNIIVTADRDPVLIDFGISLAATDLFCGKSAEVLGTAGYMSPEQARGEGHLVDGRTDIFSLGVILYEMLTGHLPFEGSTEDQIDQVASSALEIRSLRQTNPRVPKALERICLKAVAKRKADRYPTARDFAEDLRLFLKAGAKRKASDTKAFFPQKVIPRGLCAFKESDFGFFVRLLPGLRDREGIPYRLRFWEQAVSDREEPFRVGVFYGPSGSGKSSFLRAGLIPLLPDWVETIYLAADPEKTEALLLGNLRARFEALAEERDPSRCIRRIREEDILPKGGKLLIIIDQFEQWLHANGGATGSDLVSALRHCDGQKVQVILTLRDDFWMAIGRFMDELGVRLEQSKNVAAIDLLDPAHARRILMEFGAYHERLPEGDGETTAEEALSADQFEFLRLVLTDMEEDGKIIPVKLALFSEMAKGQVWTRESYQRLGGVTAIGEEFFNSVFAGREANPAHRAVEKEARAILGALLPEDGGLIRGRPLTGWQLREKAGLEDNPAGFSKTMGILDGQLRLVTPVAKTDPEAEAKTVAPENAETGEHWEHDGRYQLTHDYLVPSLRQWLFRKRRESAQGRAKLRLDELAALYRARPGKQSLPSIFEWIRILWLTRWWSSWSKENRTVMAAATRFFAFRVAMILAAATGIFMVGLDLARKHGIDQLFAQYAGAPPAEAGNLLRKLEPHRDNSALMDRARLGFGSAPAGSRERLNLAVFLLPQEPAHGPIILERALEGSLADYLFAVPELVARGDVDAEVDGLWDQLSDPLLPSPKKVRMAGILAAFYSENPRWAEWSDDVVRWLTSLSQAEAVPWVEVFAPVKENLDAPLLAAFGTWNDETFQEATRHNSVVTATLLTGFRAGDPEKLLELLDRANPDQLPFVVRELARLEPVPAGLLRRHASAERPTDAPDQEEDFRIRIRAKAILTLSRLGQGEEALWKALDRDPDADPGLQSWLIHLARPAGLPVPAYAARLAEEKSPAALAAILLTLGEYDPDSLPLRDPALAQAVEDLFFQHPSPQVHAAARWLLVKWEERLEDRERSANRSGDWYERFPLAEKEDRDWYYTSRGHPMAIVRPRNVGENPATPDRVYAISMLETTVAQFREFKRTYKYVQSLASEPTCPAHYLSGDMAMAYCNWLSEKEKIPEDQYCYRRNDPGERCEWTPVDGFLNRAGYRIPTDIEFRYATRGNSSVSRPHGESLELMDRFDWFLDNAGGAFHPVGMLKPAGTGLFDVLGNAAELCHVDISEQNSVFASLGGAHRSVGQTLTILNSSIETISYPRSISSTFRLARTVLDH